MNNNVFPSPGSDHSGGANFGIGDGSVTFLSTSMDPNVFCLMGSMADGGVADSQSAVGQQAPFIGVAANPPPDFFLPGGEARQVYACQARFPPFRPGRDRRQ